MTYEPSIHVIFYDADTGKEIGIEQFYLEFPIHVGEEVHHWEDLPGGGGIRFDFIVTRVRHDLRYMPSRGGTSRYVQTLEVFVAPLTA